MQMDYFYIHFYKNKQLIVGIYTISFYFVFYTFSQIGIHLQWRHNEHDVITYCNKFNIFKVVFKDDRHHFQIIIANLVYNHHSINTCIIFSHCKGTTQNKRWENDISKLTIITRSRCFLYPPWCLFLYSSLLTS